MTLTHGGRRLRPDEVPASLQHHFYESPNLPRYTIPTYDTGGQLYTRDELIDLFREPWGGDHRINAQSVDTYLRSHFFGRNRVEPTGCIPFDPMPDIDEDMDDRTRARIVQDHENRRISSRRSRELFCVDGLPKYVPDACIPSVNNPNQVNQRMAAKINAL